MTYKLQYDLVLCQTQPSSDVSPSLIHKIPTLCPFTNSMRPQILSLSRAFASLPLLPMLTLPLLLAWLISPYSSSLCLISCRRKVPLAHFPVSPSFKHLYVSCLFLHPTYDFVVTCTTFLPP
jgi:hypothetical protein